MNSPKCHRITVALAVFRCRPSDLAPCIEENDLFITTKYGMVLMKIYLRK